MHLAAGQVSGLGPTAAGQIAEGIGVDIVRHSLDLVANLLKIKLKIEIVSISKLLIDTYRTSAVAEHRKGLDKVADWCPL